MRVVIGGAHNGKRDYVKQQLAKENRTAVNWVEGELPTVGQTFIVVSGLEKWLADFKGDDEEAIACVKEALKERESIVILTDISRGIVPMDATARALRDRCGRLYQNILAEADEVIQVWYGIPKIIKQRGEIK